MNNTRFATALHILTLLRLAGEELLSSEFLAGSININAAVVRREVSHLRDQGLVGTREGKGGGIYLAKPAADIRLSDVYKAVVSAPLLGRSNVPNPACPVGKQINGVINRLYQEAEQALTDKLDDITLAEFVGRFD